MSAPAGLRFVVGSFRGESVVRLVGPRLVLAESSSYRLVGETQAGASDGDQRRRAYYTWPPAGRRADQVVFEIQCIAQPSCEPRATGDYGNLLIGDIRFSIEDVSPPVLGGLGGALLEGPAQRGVQLLAAPATDAGGGVAGVTVKVNGKRYASISPDCALAPDGTALKLAPCPTTVNEQLAIDTTGPPFGEGKNEIEVCATDYAQETADPASFAGESCASKGVYVDNSCQVSPRPDAADVDLRFAGKRRTVGFGKRATVVGKLVDAEGKPVDGASVCLSQRDDVEGAPEIDLGQVETNRAGAARVKLPPGASRRVKLTYWADAEEVEIRQAKLGVRARPDLKVLSKRKLTDGGRVRFRVRLAGPYRAHRRVAVQALAPAGWLDFPGCVGKTDGAGRFECSYRFREQEGDVEYAFRALAPRQPEYPFLQGRTKPVEVSVRD